MCQGIREVAVVVLVIGAGAVVVSGATAVAGAGRVFAVAGAAAAAVTGSVAVIVSGATAVAGAVAVAGAGALAGAVATAVIGAVVVTGVFSIAVAGAEALGRTGAGVVAVAVATAIAEMGKTFTVAGAVTVAGVFAIPVACLGWRALRGDERDAWLRSFAIAFAAIGGTSFRGADLTEANFTGAKLKSTDLREADLTRVRWYGAKMLDRVRPGDTYLKKIQVRQWLIGKGKNKDFNGQYLRGINLQGADLKDASFIDANLSEANLQDADLSRSKLVKTQLDETDFTGATLTGAFIEDWGITTHTKLEEVKCEHVFMRLPTKEDPNPHRKPDNWEENFEGDDFADFIKPIFDTLDLYHNQGVDPRAIAISWKQLAEKNPDANLRFASMEVKGEDNLLLRLKTELNADLSQLSADYFETYNQIKALAEAESKKLLAEKDDRIRSLESFVKTALRQSTRTININQGNYNEEIEGDYHEA